MIDPKHTLSITLPSTNSQRTFSFAMSIHFTLIRYDKNSNYKLNKNVINRFDSYHEIWTSNSTGRFISNINEALEFSGYQEAVHNVIDYLRTQKNSNVEQRCAIIIANDTVFSSHFSLLVRYIYHASINIYKTNPSQRPTLTGLFMPANPDIKLIVKAPRYLSTWLFMVEGTINELQNLRFYGSNVNIESFTKDIYLNLPDIYRQSVDSWLQPTHWLKGWYQAVPGRPLPSSTLNRKRFAIYLEHTLPVRAMQSGFDVSCLSQRLGLISRVLLTLLRLLDRAYVNLLKLYYRLFAL